MDGPLFARPNICSPENVQNQYQFHTRISACGARTCACTKMCTHTNRLYIVITFVSWISYFYSFMNHFIIIWNYRRSVKHSIPRLFVLKTFRIASKVVLSRVFFPF